MTIPNPQQPTPPLPPPQQPTPPPPTHTQPTPPPPTSQQSTSSPPTPQQLTPPPPASQQPTHSTPTPHLPQQASASQQTQQQQTAPQQSSSQTAQQPTPQQTPQPTQQQPQQSQQQAPTSQQTPQTNPTPAPTTHNPLQPLQPNQVVPYLSNQTYDQVVKKFKADIKTNPNRKITLQRAYVAVPPCSPWCQFGYDTILALATTDPEEVEKWFDTLYDRSTGQAVPIYPYIGIDVEFVGGRQDAAIIQLGVDRGGVFEAFICQVRFSLFLCDRRIIKVLHDGANDVKALKSLLGSGRTLACNGFVNIHKLARVAYEASGVANPDPIGHTPGLEILAKWFLDCQLKEIKGGSAGWVKEELDKKFLDYAIKDPWSQYEIFWAINAHVWCRYDEGPGRAIMAEAIDRELIEFASEIGEGALGF
ncbi:hypothetical protein HDV00_011367 [Rhizophlyctis rosea]|nr:hypothetical protein HDV00_011367 [Rhizophlyctis rosea]